MSKLAYFDLASGASGDMIIAALADAGRRIGVNVEGAIADAIESLGLGCTVTFIDDERRALACLRADVKTDDERLTPSRLREAIAGADVPDIARARAIAGLDTLVRAEAAVHGRHLDDVHLHELGSPDTAADLIGAAAGLHALGITSVGAAPPPLPSGWVETEHGSLPLPAPVTLELLKGVTVRGIDASTEVLTPTGAAILLAHDAKFGPLPTFTLTAVGTGGGQRDTGRPNICRVLVGSTELEGARTEECILLETNIDDQTPEALGHAVEALVRTGALDAWITPIVMKKTRPAFLLSVLVRPADEARIVEDVFRRTTTLGIRRRSTTRWALERTEIHVRVRDHDVRVKMGRLGGEVVNAAPEFADCAAVSDKTGVPVKDVYAEAAAAARVAAGEQ